jgi:hypothetical protein
MNHAISGDVSFKARNNAETWIEDPCVILPEFGAWAKSLGVTLPTGHDRAPDPAQATRENTLPNIIGAMLALFLNTDDDGKPLSVFQSQTKIIEALVDRYEHRPGISESNLEKMFAQANKSLNES